MSPNSRLTAEAVDDTVEEPTDVMGGERAIRRRRSDRLDRFQRRHPILGFPIAVFYKFLDDQGVYLAALITYYAFLSVFPLLLLFASIVGFVLQDDPQLRREVLDSALNQFPIIREQIVDQSSLRGSVLGVVVGGLVALYGALGVAQATQHVMNTAWAVPRNRRPNPLVARLRSMLLLGTGGLVVVTLMVVGGFANTVDTFDGDIDAWFKAGVAVLGITINALIFVIGFRITTAIKLSTRQVIVGAFVNACCWYLLQLFGATVIADRLQGTSATYGTFSLVLGMFGWFFVAAIALVLSVEVNVVRTKKLYPRALLTPFTDDVDLTDADQRIYAEIVGAQRLKGFAVVDVHFRHEGQFASARRSLAPSMPLHAAPGTEPASGAEPVEVVHHDGVVERIASRAEVRNDRLRHRVTMVAILHPDRDDVLVHQRSPAKDIWADRWDFAFGGIVGVGEAWEDAAVRELAEESGLQLEPGDLESLGPAVAYDDDEVAELTRAWLVRSEGPFSFDDGEVVQARWLPLEEFSTWSTATTVCPDTVAVFTPHLRQLGA